MNSSPPTPGSISKSACVYENGPGLAGVYGNGGESTSAASATSTVRQDDGDVLMDEYEPDALTDEYGGVGADADDADEADADEEEEEEGAALQGSCLWLSFPAAAAGNDPSSDSGRSRSSPRRAPWLPKSRAETLRPGTAKGPGDMAAAAAAAAEAAAAAAASIEGEKMAGDAADAEAEGDVPNDSGEPDMSLSSPARWPLWPLWPLWLLWPPTASPCAWKRAPAVDVEGGVCESPCDSLEPSNDEGGEGESAGVPVSEEQSDGSLAIFASPLCAKYCSCRKKAQGHSSRAPRGI